MLIWLKKNKILLIILILATVIRLYHIGLRDFWFDEAFTGITVRTGWGEMLRILAADTHPPLYFLGLKLFSYLFGSGVDALRLFSAIFGIGGVWGIYLFTKELFSARSAFFASFLAAISPFLWQYSQETRMYSMLGYLVVWASFFFVRALKRNRYQDYVGWGIFLGLACLTHNMGLIFALVYFPAFIVWNYQENGLKKALLNKKFWTGAGIAFVLFLPWLKNFVNQLLFVHERIGWITPAYFSEIFRTVQMFLWGTPLGQMGMPTPNDMRFVSSESVLVLLIILLTSITIWLFTKSTEKKQLLLVYILSFGFLGLVYMLSLLGQQFFVARYLIAGNYFVCVLLGVATASLPKKWPYVALGVYVFSLFLIKIPNYSRGFNVLSSKVSSVSNHMYVFNPFDYIIAKYYFGPDNLVLYNIDDPKSDPSAWSGMNGTLQRTETALDILQDKQAIIIEDEYLQNNDAVAREDLLKNFTSVITSYNLHIYQAK